MSIGDRGGGGRRTDDDAPDSVPPSSRMPASTRFGAGARQTLPPSSRHPGSSPPASAPPSTLSSMQKAIVALDKVKARLDAVERQKTEPIAILGMACRFPGGGTSPEAFFRFLMEGGDAVTQVPKERWQADLSDEADADPERRATRWGAFLRDPVDPFDARFFGISPREAAHLDPQHRLLLELAWEALERAGQDPGALVGTQTGVFVGTSTNDYLELCRAGGPEGADVYAATGNGPAFASGRLSYVLGLQGPSVAVDTACSSSLVAVHLACQSLRSGEATLALAAGVNLMLSPSMTRLVSTTKALAPDGRCRTFDAGAGGFVRGEGGGVVVLKLLSEAQRDGDPILAMIRGSAVNQDGRSTGLTTPNVLSQQAMLRQALASARISADDIGYVEAHGTGTSLGDPIELEALKAVIGRHPRLDRSRCVLGAVKTNIGHLEAAAGIAGLIKAVMALQMEVIPRNLHFRALNPRISLEGTPFVIPTESLPWRRGDKPRLAGVSSFGLSGTNGHVVLEEAGGDRLDDVPAPEASSYLVPISARSPGALRALARSYATALCAEGDARLHDIAYTASVRRAHHEHRLAVAGRTHAEIAAGFAAFADDEAAGRAPRTASERRPRVVFVFPGQGSQWIGMARQLLREERAFRESIEAYEEPIRRLGGFSVQDQIWTDEASSRLGEIHVVQPVLLAIEVALANLWRSWGVEPDAVIGHSMGEVAAARVSGVLTLEDSAKVICRRSRLLRRVSGKGAMALVELGLPAAEQALDGYEDRLGVAVSNGPRSTVISGDPGALDEVLGALEKAGVFCRRVKVDVASHSPQMDPLREDLLMALRNVQPRPARLPMRSTVTGEPVRGPELDASYWAKNLREPVLFSTATQRLIDDGLTLFIEMSPHPILLQAVEENLREKNSEGAVVASMRRGTDERRTMLAALGAVYARGYPVEWKRLIPAGRCVPLPTYPWQRERHWIEGLAALHAALPGADPLADWMYEVAWRRVDGAPAAGPGAGGGAWLLFEDRSGLGAELCARLRARGEAVVRVLAGPGFALLGPDRYEIDPTSAADHDALLGAAFEGRACRGVVHLASLDATPWDLATAETLRADQRIGFLGAVSAVQAILRGSGPRRPGIWLVTRGAQAVGGAPVTGVAEAPVWGLGRTIQLEHPELRCALVDLDPARGSEGAADLLAEIDAAGAEPQVALRGGARHVARLCKTSFEAAPERAFHVVADASYLVTGGLGGLGLSLAGWLVDQGARHLALVGRRGPSPEAREAIAAMEAKGAEVLVLASDVSVRADVDRVLGGIASCMPPLRGIAHAAGLAGGTVMIPDLGERDLWPLLAPKLLGTFHLLAATTALPLEFLVLYSSASAPLGLVGHAPYAAANAALDAVSGAMRRSGLRVVSVQWGPFSETGLAARDGVAERMGRGGLGSMTPAQGSAAVGRLLARPRAEVAVMALSPERWFEVFPEHASAPFWSELAVRAEGARAPAPAVEQRFRQTFAAAAPADRGAILLRHVREQLGKILRMDAALIEPSLPFHFYGFDSLMGLELRNRLQTSLELGLSMADILTHARVDELCALLAGRLDTAPETPPARRETPTLRAPGTAPAAPEPGEPAKPAAKAGSWIVIPRPSPGARMRLFCFPYAGGAAHIFSAWPAGLPPEIEVCAIQPPGRHERLHEPLLGSVGEMIDALVPAMLPYLDRPFATFGHCLGAIVMFEALRELEKLGKKPIHAFAAAAPVPRKYAVPNVTRRSPEEFADLLGFIGFTRTGVLGDADAERYLLPAVKADFEVAARYRHVPSAPLDVSLTIFSGREDTFAPPYVVDEWVDETTAWSSKVVFPGEHYFIVPERPAVLSVIRAELLLRLASIEQQGRARAAQDHATPWVRTPSPRAAPRARLFCFPGVGDGSAVYDRWPAMLGRDVEVCIVDLPGRGARVGELPLGRVDEIVDHVVPAIRGLLDLPYAFFGIDVGAILSFETARRLRREGLPPPAHLLVLAAMAPQDYFWAPMHHQPRERLFQGLRTLGFTVDQGEATEPALRAECAAMASYVFAKEPRLDVPITTFWGERDYISPAVSVRGWKEQTSAAFTFTVWPGGHSVDDDDIAVVLGVVQEKLEEAASR
jgi:acyl transferase domain-containing protein/surfactin synthase thioesterase subunit